MREIKFRAWDFQKKDWASRYCDEIIGGLEMPVNDYFKSNGKEVTRWDFQQYTGLKDKSGKEIYEGDIICFRPKGYYGYCNRHGAVVYDDKLGKWHFGYGNGSSTRKHSYTFKSVHDIEVLGNIHENPELLEEEK